MNFQNLRIRQLNLEIEILKFEIDRLNFEIMNFVNLKLYINFKIGNWKLWNLNFEIMTLDF